MMLVDIFLNKHLRSRLLHVQPTGRDGGLTTNERQRSLEIETYVHCQSVHGVKHLRIVARRVFSLTRTTVDASRQ